MAQWIRPLWAASDEYKYISHSPLTVRNCPTASLCTQLTLCRNREDALDCYLPDLFFYTIAIILSSSGFFSIWVTVALLCSRLVQQVFLKSAWQHDPANI